MVDPQRRVKEWSVGSDSHHDHLPILPGRPTRVSPEITNKEGRRPGNRGRGPLYDGCPSSGRGYQRNEPSSVTSYTGSVSGLALSLRSASRIRSNAGPSSRRPPRLRLCAPASVSEAPA